MVYNLDKIFEGFINRTKTKSFNDVIPDNFMRYPAVYIDEDREVFHNTIFNFLKSQGLPMFEQKKNKPYIVMKILQKNARFPFMINIFLNVELWKTYKNKDALTFDMYFYIPENYTTQQIYSSDVIINKDNIQQIFDKHFDKCVKILQKLNSPEFKSASYDFCKIFNIYKDWKILNIYKDNIKTIDILNNSDILQACFYFFMAEFENINFIDLKSKYSDDFKSFYEELKKIEKPAFDKLIKKYNLKPNNEFK